MSMNLKGLSMVIIPEEELDKLKTTQLEILNELKELRLEKSQSKSISMHITAKEYMQAVRICRSKFDQLVSANKIKTIKKRRKIYVPSSEIERFFNDPSIQ